MRTELVTTLKRRATEMRLQRRVAILEGIASGERAIEGKRVVSHAKARTRMARWLK